MKTMRNNLINNIIKIDNLLWAWKKAKKSYVIGDIWFDPIELSRFEANLKENLESIKNDIENTKYELACLKPMPYPKSYDDEDQQGRIRQTFYVSVRDQVTWIAVVNIIGPDLDYQMPFWSYGNRLFVSGWYENEDSSNKKWHIGHYRNSSGRIYKSWKQSWPRYIHNIALTCKVMASATTAYTPEDKNEIEGNDSLKGNFKVEYLTTNYWPEQATSLYWASVDLKKFYPSVKPDVVYENIIAYHNDDDVKSQEFQSLLSSLLTFRIERKDWDNNEIEEINKPHGCINGDLFNGIPTGLFVAGFLCNVAMLEVDLEITHQLSLKKDVAVFKYVDDHVVLAYSFEALTKWINEYMTLVEEKNIGVLVNPEKTDPTELKEYLNNERIDEEIVKTKCLLDPSYPSPLMTHTLAKVSGLGSTDLEFLSDVEEQQLITDLEHLLLTDFPDHEIKKDTRISFAAGMLARIMPKRIASYDNVYKIRKKIYNKLNSIDNIRDHKAIKNLKIKLSDKYLFDKDDKIEHIEIACSRLCEDKDNMGITTEFIEVIKEQLLNVNKELIQLTKELRRALKEITEKETTERVHTYKLIRKATKENFDKLKLWRRIIDYCYNTELDEYNNILSIIDELDDEKLVHDLVTPFLYSTFIYLICEKLLYATKIYINAPTKDLLAIHFIKSTLSKEFLDNIFRLETLSDKDYYKSCFIYLREILGSIAYILNIEKSEDFSFVYSYNSIRWDDNSNEWIRDNCTHSINDLLFYILKNCSNKTNTVSNQYWIGLSNFIEYTEKGAKPLIQGFPYLSKDPSLFKNEGIIYEEQHSDSSVNYDTPTLYDWIKWSAEYKASGEKEHNLDRLYDPRLSEWFSLNIICCLAKMLKTKESPKQYFGLTNDVYMPNIHPANFTISAEWIKQDNIQSWDYWRREFESESIISLSDNNINDKRYFPDSINKQYNNSDLSGIHSLSVILISLLSHDTSFPWLWNASDLNIEWNMLLLSKLNNIPVSSYTMNILQACLWDKNRETTYWIERKLVTINGYIKNDDSLNDPPIIDNIDDMIGYVSKAIRRLESYQLSLGVSKPRQLTPISLKQLSKSNIASNNIYSNEPEHTT